MKQYITPKQLKELSKEGKIKLVDWFNKKQGTNFEEGNIVLSEEPYLSIGEMIELLGEDWVQVVFDNKYQMQWFPCDALWEACKEVLESI